MSVLAAPGRNVGQEPAADGFYARALSVNTRPFSKRVSSVDVDVLAGSVRKGDPLEIIRSDGSAMPAIADRTFVSDFMGMHTEGLVLHDFQLQQDELGALDVVRTPGLAVPALRSEGERPGTARLLEAVRAARANEFPASAPVKGIAEVAATRFREALPRLPDQAVVLIVQNQLARVRARSDDAHGFALNCQIAAAHLGAIGLQEDGDRLLLAAAASLRGHKVSPALRAVASAVGVGVLAAEGSTFGVGKTAKGLGWALGIEMGDAFSAGWKSGVSALGEGIETNLLEAGRAVEVAWCDKCGDAVTLDRQRCPKDGKKPKDRFAVVRADAPLAEAALRTDRPSGGFWRR